VLLTVSHDADGARDSRVSEPPRVTRRCPAFANTNTHTHTHNADTQLQTPLDGPDQTLSETDPGLRQVRGLCLVGSGPVRSGPCSGLCHGPDQTVAGRVWSCRF